MKGLYRDALRLGGRDTVAGTALPAVPGRWLQDTFSHHALAPLPQIAAQLVALRSRFPSADVAAMAAAHPALLCMPSAELEAAVAAVAAEFPDASQVGAQSMDGRRAGLRLGRVLGRRAAAGTGAGQGCQTGQQPSCLSLTSSLLP